MTPEDCTRITGDLHLQRRRRITKSWLSFSPMAVMLAVVLVVGSLLADIQISGAAPLPTVTCPSNLNSCSAKELGTKVVKVEILNGDVCNSLTDTINLRVTTEFDATANTRYDVGVFVSKDGGTVQEPSSALSCAGAAPQVGEGNLNAYLADADTDLFLNEEGAGDTCGDVKASAGPVQWTFDVTVACNIVNGQLKIPSCRVWDQNAGINCTSLTQAGTGSKCDCTDLVVTAQLNPCATTVCNDGNSCTTDSCVNNNGVAQCVYTNDDSNSCTDGNACTNDACVSGQCVGTPIPTDDNNVCTTDSCNNGQVLHTPITSLQPTTCGKGECASTGFVGCNNGVLQSDTCTPGTPGAEVCDNKDNDCDGTTDEDLTRETSCGKGECAAKGSETCVAGQYTNNTCTPGTPGAEVCDAKDNDCDGATDEDLTKNTTCGVGECTSTGVIECVNGVLQPDTCKEKPKSAEVCDAKDNDCDGATDEDLTQNTTCGVGECAATGQILCTNGVLQPDTCKEKPKSAEVCDAKDNDCDGATDEGGDDLCNDGKVCTDNKCEGAAGCKYTNNTAKCDDGDACTDGDTCNAGQCEGTKTELKLTVIKKVVNDNGGTRQASDFRLGVSANGQPLQGSPFPGSSLGSTYTLTNPSATYSVTEDLTNQNGADLSPLYAKSLSQSCDGTLSCDGTRTATCTVTNDDLGSANKPSIQVTANPWTYSPNACTNPEKKVQTISGSFRVVNASSAQPSTVTVSNMSVLLEYRDEAKGLFTTLIDPANCTFSPAAAFSFTTTKDVTYTCNVATLPVNTAIDCKDVVKATVNVNIVNGHTQFKSSFSQQISQ